MQLNTTRPTTARQCVWTVVAALLLTWIPSSARAGKLPGLPVPVPPGRESPLQFGWENDFLARGGEFDDQRTLQLSIDARLGERWHAVVDYSILTNEGPRVGFPDAPGSEGRIDEWGLSFARRWQSSEGRLLVGAGLRSTGHFAGARIQNGFHQMVGARIVALPYLDEHRTDATFWLTADREHTQQVGTGRWRAGWWLSGAAQVITSGQLNGNAGAYALLRHESIQFLLGADLEWREGAPDNVVEVPTAETERGPFGVAGIGLGPLELATYQRLDGDVAYGRVTLRSGPGPTALRTEPNRANVYVGMRLPGTAWRLGGAVAPEGLTALGPAGGRLGVAGEFSAGNSPIDDTIERFLVERQWTAGLAWFGPALDAWIAPMLVVSGGYRTERLSGAGRLEGLESNTVGRAVIAGEIGADLRMTDWPNGSALALRLSLSGHVPFGSEVARLGLQGYRLQIPGGGIVAAVVLGAGT